MRTTEGPFAMETTYEWADRTGDAHDPPQPRRAFRLLAPGGSAPRANMRKANRKDLERLKSLL